MKIGERFGKVGFKRGLAATAGKFQLDCCSNWDREMIEKNRMLRSPANAEFLEMRKGD